MPANGEFKGMKVVAYEDVAKAYPASDFEFFAPMSPRRMNADRERMFRDIQQKGYRMISYVSSSDDFRQ